MKKIYQALVVGLGYWGPNLARNFYQNSHINLHSLCDINIDRCYAIQKFYPDVNICNDYRDIKNIDDIDIVAIATPVSTHYQIAKWAIKNKKHVFIEKPFTSSSQEAKELINLASKHNVKIMVDHTFLYTGAVQCIKSVISDHQLGDIRYFDSTRINLGLIQSDINVIWDLAPHDFSIMDYIFTQTPIALSAQGIDFTKHNQDKTLESLAYITVYFESDLIAHFNLNWLSPVKIRSTIIGGTKKMLVFNDLEPAEKIKIYDHGINIQNQEDRREIIQGYHTGDIYSPKVDTIEALKKEIVTFIQYIENKIDIPNDAVAGLRIVQLLEACDQSLRNKGEIVSLPKTLEKVYTYG